MISTLTMWAKMCDNFPHSTPWTSAVFDALTGAWDEVATNMLDEALCIDFMLISSVERVTMLFSWDSCTCCPIATWCFWTLQLEMPSYHEWAKLVFPALPHFPNQEPPRPQQLILPDFAIVPHTGHMEIMGVVVTAGSGVWKMVKRTKRKMLSKLLATK